MEPPRHLGQQWLPCRLPRRLNPGLILPAMPSHRQDMQPQDPYFTAHEISQINAAYEDHGISPGFWRRCQELMLMAAARTDDPRHMALCQRASSMMQRGAECTYGTGSPARQETNGESA